MKKRINIWLSLSVLAIVSMVGCGGSGGGDETRSITPIYKDAGWYGKIEVEDIYL